MVMPMNQGFVFNASVSEAYVLHFDHVLLSLWNEGFMVSAVEDAAHISSHRSTQHDAKDCNMLFKTGKVFSGGYTDKKGYTV